MIPYSRQQITQEDRAAILEVLDSDYLTQGPAVSDFEEALKEKFAVNHAIACSSGTSALHLSLAGLGINQETIGIVPAITFAATANAFRYLGADVRFCDVNSETGLICLESLKAVLNTIEFKSKVTPGVIAPVSFAGATAPLPDIKNLAKSYQLKVIEDASHSPGAYVNEKQANCRSLSCEYTDAACLSFHPVKHICCGEGGAVLTNNEIIGNRIRKLRSHGIERPYSDADETPWFYQQTELGWNYRITDIQAALGNSQLTRLDDQLLARRKIAQVYETAFAEYPFNECFHTPELTAGHSWHLFIIRFKKPGVRNHAYKFLKDRGIMTQVHYIPVYRHPYYQKEYGNLHLKGAEQFFQSCLSIPMFPSLQTKEQQEVIDQLGNFCHSQM